MRGIGLAACVVYRDVFKWLCQWIAGRQRCASYTARRRAAACIVYSTNALCVKQPTCQSCAPRAVCRRGPTPTHLPWLTECLTCPLGGVKRVHYLLTSRVDTGSWYGDDDDESRWPVLTWIRRFRLYTVSTVCLTRLSAGYTVQTMWLMVVWPLSVEHTTKPFGVSW